MIGVLQVACVGTAITTRLNSIGTGVVQLVGGYNSTTIPFVTETTMGVEIKSEETTAQGSEGTAAGNSYCSKDQLDQMSAMIQKHGSS